MDRFGKHKAIVFDINDPEKRGRIKVKCPSVIGDATSAWCEALVIGNDLHIPKVGDGVWVEFEQGDINSPIYVGSWWGKNQTPTTELSGRTRMIEFNGNKIILDTVITLISQDGTKVRIGNGNISINDVTVSLSTHSH